MLHMKVVQRVNPKSSRHQEKGFFFQFFNVVATEEDEASLDALWSFHGLCQSTHYLLHPKF